MKTGMRPNLTDLKAATTGELSETNAAGFGKIVEGENGHFVAGTWN
jgi:hypothetical protein